MKKKIYVACPYTKGNASINVRNAVMAAERLCDAGFTPYNPLLTHLWQLISPHDIDFWYEYDNEWLPVCDGLLRLPGESAGADKEIELMMRLGKPVFHSLESLIEHFIARRESC